MNANMIHLAATVHQAELHRAANEGPHLRVEQAVTESALRNRTWKSIWSKLHAPAVKPSSATTIQRHHHRVPMGAGR